VRIGGDVLVASPPAAPERLDVPEARAIFGDGGALYVVTDSDTRVFV
jgi:hypothetical protein